ncbi:MAG: hypothetical protein RLZZ500_805 [Bacteroidota bacterium]|jgi:hypothetical protein
MRKIVFFIVVLTAFNSCKHADDTTASDAKTSVKDSTIAGADQDEHGCLASAGFTWSKMYKDCVRMFTGLQLSPVDQPQTDDETVCAYVLFSEDKNKAEVFIPNAESIILTRSKEGQPWIYQEYQLVPWKGYILKKGETNCYFGDGEIGNKFSGNSDTE